MLHEHTVVGTGPQGWQVAKVTPQAVAGMGSGEVAQPEARAAGRLGIEYVCRVMSAVLILTIPEFSSAKLRILSHRFHIISRKNIK